MADQSVGDRPDHAHGHWVLAVGASINRVGSSTYNLDRNHGRTGCYGMGRSSTNLLFARRRSLFPRLGRRTRFVSGEQRHTTTIVSLTNNIRLSSWSLTSHTSTRDR